MDWQTFLTQIKDEHTDLGGGNPQVEIYDANTGTKYRIVTIYNEAGILCLDIAKEDNLV